MQFINKITLVWGIIYNKKEKDMTEETMPLSPTELGFEASDNENLYLVKERYEVRFDAPLPQFDTNGAVAFETSDKTNPQKELFALVCSNEAPPRLSILPYLKSIDHPNILKLVEFGVVSFPAKKSRNVVLIYKKPTGPKISEYTESAAELTTNFDKFKSQIISIASACECLKGRNITHRAIRRDNIYYKDSSCTELVLGDCAASFPSVWQPSEYETVENLLALPQGRGDGKVADDLYAAGLVMIEQLLQKDIRLNLSVPELLRLKLKKTSFNALTESEKIYSQFTLPLKGMLNDSVENRWGYLQIYNYFEGKSVPFNEATERSTRAITFAGEKFYTASGIAVAMLNNPSEALNLIYSGKILEWIKNGLENEKLYTKIEAEIRSGKEDAALQNRDLVSQVCIYLDPSLPIKSGELYVFPEGLPKAIFYYMQNNLNLTDFYNLLTKDHIKTWYQEQPSLRAPSNSNEFKNYINRKDYGYGIDRIMYDFDDDLPCISPLVRGDFINTPSRLLKALDSNYQSFKDKKPYDRNIIAYLRCKMGKKIDGILTDLNSHNEALQSSAVLRLFANIQNKYGPVQLHNLALWMLNIIKPIVYTYHNLKYQKYLERQLIKVAKSGKLIDFHEILENEEARQKDKKDYSSASKEIKLLVSERTKLTTNKTRLDDEARSVAYKFVSMLAVLIMTTSLLFGLIFWMVQ